MIRTFWRFRKGVRLYRTALVVGWLLSLLAAAAAVAAPWPLLVIVDNVLGGEPFSSGPDSIVRLVADWNREELLGAAVLAFLVAVSINALADYLATFAFRGAAERFTADLRAPLFAEGLGDGDGQSAELALARTALAPNHVRDMLVASLLAVPNLMLIGGIVAVMVLVDPVFAVLALAVAPFVFLTALGYTRRIARADEATARKEAELSYAGRFRAWNLERLSAGLNVVGLQSKLSPVVDVLTALGVALVLWFGARRILRDEMTLGLLLVFLAYVSQLHRPMRNLAKVVSLPRRFGGVERLEEVLAAMDADTASRRPAPTPGSGRRHPKPLGAPPVHVPRHAAAGKSRHALRTFIPFIKAHWRGFVPALLGVIAISVIGLAKPWPLKFLIDDVLHVGEGGVQPEASLALIGAIAGAIVGIAVLQGLFNFIKDFFLSATSQRVAFSLRRTLFAHVQQLSLAFHDRQRTGEMMTRVTSDVTKMQELVTDKLLVDGVASTLQFAGMLAVMFVIDWQLGLVAVAWAPLVVLASAYFRRRIKAEEEQVRRREGLFTSLTQETMSSIRVVKAFGRERHAVERFEEETGEMLEASVNVARLEARFSWVITILTASGLAAMVFFGAYRVLEGVLSAGILVVFIQYMRDLQNPLNTLSKLWTRLARVMVRAERIMEVLGERPAVEPREDARPAPPFRGHIRFTNVTFGYEPGRPVLRGIDLTIGPGESVAVVGPTGAGKSTIASLLLRLYDPDEGAVEIDGHDIREYTPDSLIDQIAVVLQESLLFQASITENIAYGRLGATAPEIDEAARIAYADQFVHRLPHGFDTVVGERGTTLSGGQRQRIAIARAVIRDAPILVLDEPTTGLDAEAEEIVMRAIERLMRGRSTLMIAHNLSTVRRADRIYVLDGGRIVEEGTHATLVARGGGYARAFAAQSADGGTSLRKGVLDRLWRAIR